MRRRSPPPAGAAFAAAGFAGVHLVYVESMEAVDRERAAGRSRVRCLRRVSRRTAAPWRPPATAEIVKPDWSGYRYDYPETVMAFLGRDTVPYTRYPAVFPNWDNTPRQPLRGTSFERCHPGGVPGLRRGEDRGSAAAS